MTAAIPPIARKKAVPGKYDPNSYRVISMDAETIVKDPHRQNIFIPSVDFNAIGQRESTHPSQEHRHHKPHPGNVKFLRQDVRLMLEPVCKVYTTGTKCEEHLWWPSTPSDEPLKSPPKTFDSTSRADYQWRGSDVMKNSRHGSNPHKEPVDGIVPVHQFKKPNGRQRLWKENISYEHMYDCRLDPSYPIRSKRHGGFVWDEFPPSEVSKMLHLFGYQADKHQQTDITKNNMNNKSTTEQTTQPTPPAITPQNQTVDGSLNNTNNAVNDENGLPPVSN